MGEFQELIRNFDKIRDYMRDFYIYGFKSRSDFTRKSTRTYDNEKRRIESYMGKYMKWEYTKTGKNLFISMDCARVPVNPLYAAWKSKTFTSNDIMLHFYLLDILNMESKLSIDNLTDLISVRSGQVFDTQTVRNKCNEYTNLGIMKAEKYKKSLFYSLSDDTFHKMLPSAPGLKEAVKFFQGSSVFGEIGSFIMDNQQLTNDLFTFKHYYAAHTLEDGILLELLSAIRNKQLIEFVNINESGTRIATFDGVPVKIFVSAVTGRRYLCLYKTRERRFFNYRLDHMKEVSIKGICKTAELHQTDLKNNLVHVFGVSFGGQSRKEIVCMKLFVNEKTEAFILDRLIREGQGGELIHLEENTYLYTKEVFDSNDMSPWIKSFTGRILQLEGTNQIVIDRFYKDIKRMKEMYED